MKIATIESIRKALIKVSWNSNHSKRSVKPLLVVYPNELLYELFGDLESGDYYIPENKAKKYNTGVSKWNCSLHPDEKEHED